MLHFDVAAPDIYGTMAAVIRRAARNPRPRRMDLQIAATSCGALDTPRHPGARWFSLTLSGYLTSSWRDVAVPMLLERRAY